MISHVLRRPDLRIIATSGTSQVVKAIGRRRLDWKTASTEPMHQYRVDKPMKSESAVDESKAVPPLVENNHQHAPRGASSDPARMEHLALIDQLRKEYQVRNSRRASFHSISDSKSHLIQSFEGGDDKPFPCNSARRFTPLA